MRPLIALLLLTTIATSAATGQSSNEPSVPEKAGKELRAFRINGNAPEVDGRLDDPVWALADSIDDLVQWEPDNMVPMSERTVIRVAYDERYLYIAAYCYDSEPSRIGHGFGRRDDFPPSDQILIGFDPRHDHLTGYVYQTNPSGVFGDFGFVDDERRDRDYDGVWEVRTGVTGQGWTAEFRIPFSQMRFSVPEGAGAGAGAVWGLGVRRTIQRKGEQGQWVGRPRGDRGQVSRWGHLIFADGLSAPRRVEVLPYTAARREDLSGDGDIDHEALAGADFRVGLGTAATLSGTVNPDFGQVELDPAVLNLTIFESFFPEKRPFFLEDSRTFLPAFGIFRLFHSRRIGRRPSRYGIESTDRLVDRPDQTTIVGAAKVTGKSAGWTYGMVSTLTAREFATVDSVSVDLAGVETTTRTSRMIEPLTSYSAARIQRDILGGSSNIGALITSVIREQDDNAFAGGIDYRIRWDRNRFQWNGHWAMTHAPGSGGFATGFGGVSNFGRNGKHFGFNVHLDHFGPDFRVTDLGFIRARTDRTSLNGGFDLTQPDPKWIFRRISVFVNGGQAWNTDRLVFQRAVGTGFSMQFRNFWNVFANVFHGFQVLDDRDTRGGPPIVEPANTSGGLFINSDSRKSWRLSLGVFGSDDVVGGWNVNIRPELTLQPSSRLQTSISTNYGFGRNAAQWITNGDFDGDGETDYVYGTLRRNVVNVTARATYAFTRDLSFQLFLQPFVAVGDYTNIRKLARPRSFEFEPVALSFDPNFNSKSLRGNLVLRWEYVRGSTIFFVWNLSTFDSARPGEFDLWQDLKDTFRADGSHVFMIKANYWLNL